MVKAVSYRGKLPNRRAGYTLVELMIAVTIIGIVASIAVPAYSAYTMTTRQTLAANTLHRIAMTMEHYYARHHRYPEDINQMNIDSDDGWYRYLVETPEDNRYTVSATPLADKNFRVSLRLDHLGRQQSRSDELASWQNGWP